jgi:hypothetical protein
MFRKVITLFIWKAGKEREAGKRMQTFVAAECKNFVFAGACTPYCGGPSSVARQLSEGRRYVLDAASPNFQYEPKFQIRCISA